MNIIALSLFKLVSGRASCPTAHNLQCMWSLGDWGCFSANPPPESVKQCLEESRCPLSLARELNHAERLNISQPSLLPPLLPWWANSVIKKASSLRSPSSAQPRPRKQWAVRRCDEPQTGVTGDIREEGVVAQSWHIRERGNFSLAGVLDSDLCQVQRWFWHP